MRVLWTSLGIMGLAVLLTSCGPDTPTPPPPPKPCKVPTDLPDNAMGKLGIRTIQIGNNIRIIIPSDNVFVGRSAEIDKKAYPALNDVAKFLAKHRHTRMIVSGYTDEMGTYKRDATLSQHQAESLITYFWTRGIDQHCLTPVGMSKAESGTIASNRSLQGKAYNRRVEINFRA